VRDKKVFWVSLSEWIKKWSSIISFIHLFQQETYHDEIHIQ